MPRGSGFALRVHRCLVRRESLLAHGDGDAMAMVSRIAAEGAAVVTTSVTVASPRRSSVAASSTLTAWNAMAADAPAAAASAISVSRNSPLDTAAESDDERF